MSSYKQLTIAQLRIFARNRAVIFFSLLFPILLMVAIGSFAGSGGLVAFDTILIDQDQTEESAQLVKQLRSQVALSLTEGEDEAEARAQLEQSDAQLVIVIPEGYGQQVQSFQTAQAGAQLEEGGSLASLKVYYDDTNLNAVQVGVPLINQVADQVSKGLAHYTQLVTVETSGVQGAELEYVDFLVPGIVAMMIMQSNLNGVAGQIASWRERGILRRMQSTTLKASSFIAAQITARLILNGLQAVIVLLVGNLFFGTQVNGSWPLLILFVILGTLTFMSIGFIIASLAKTPETAAPIAGLVSFPLLFLGGVFFPVKEMPGFLQPIVELLPITHLSTSLRQVMNVGAGMADLWQDALLLGGWMALAFVIASVTFKWE